MKKPSHPGWRLCLALVLLVTAAYVARRSHRLAGAPAVQPMVAAADTGFLQSRPDGRQLLEEFTRAGTPLVLSELGFADPPVILDETGDPSDWLEVTNRTSRQVDLTDWRLGFGPRLAATWALPEVTLPAGGSLILWLSGEDRMGSTLARPCEVSLHDSHEGELLITAPAGERPSFHVRPPPPRSVRVQVAVSEALTAQAWLKLVNERNGETVLEVSLDGAPLAPVTLREPGTHQVRLRTNAGVRSFALDPGLHEVRVRCVEGGAELRYVSLVDDGPGHEGANLHAHLPETVRAGEVIQLLSPRHEVMDRLKVPVPEPGLSWQRTDERRGRRAFAPPTPWGAAFVAPPDLSALPPRSREPVRLDPPASPDGVTLRLTRDGRVPQASDPAWDAPLTLEEPGLLRVRCFRGDQPASAVVTRHFWVGPSPRLPVVMVQLDPAQLHGDNLGLDANNALRGGEWERVADVRMFEGDQVWMEGQVGLRTHAGIGVSLGNWTPFRLYARGHLGPDRLLASPFDPDGLPPQQVLVDPSFGWLRDHLAYSMVNAAGGLAPRTRPVLVYFNGALHGMGSLVERIDQEFLRARLGHAHFDLLKGKPWEVKQGDQEAFLELAQAVRESPRRSFEDLRDRVDFRSLDALHLSSLRSSAVDGLERIGEYWQGYMAVDRRATPPRVHFVAWDLDGSFEVPDLDPLATQRAHMANRAWTGRFLGPRLVQELLQEDPAYRDHYLRAVEEAWNHALAPAPWIAELDRIQQDLERWGRPQMAFDSPFLTRAGAGVGTHWKEQLSDIRRTLLERPALMFRALAEFHGLAPPATVTLQVEPAGLVLVQGHEVSGTWQGTYFEGARLRLQVPAELRGAFLGFTIDGQEVTAPEWEGAVTADRSIQARFAGS